MACIKSGRISNSRFDQLAREAQLEAEEEAKEETESKSDTDTKIIESSQIPMTTTPIFDTNTTALSITINNTNLTPNKMKLNKEELKLSPIRKKSVSSSSLLDDLQSQSDTTVLNGVLNNNTVPKINSSNSNDTNTNGAAIIVNEENKEKVATANALRVRAFRERQKVQLGDDKYKETMRIQKQTPEPLIRQKKMLK